MGYGGYSNYGPSQVAGAGYGPSPVAGFGPCSPQVAGAAYAPTPGYGSTFTLIVVLFILLIIIGATYSHC